MKSSVATLLLAVAGGAFFILAAPAAAMAAEAAPTKTAEPTPAKPAVTGTEKAPADEPLVVALGDKDVQAVGPVVVGRKIEIRAAGNPTTGYSWAVKEIKGDAVKSGGEVKYTPTPVAPKIVGSGGTFTIPLDAVKAGRAEITLVYARPWEKDKPPAASVTLNIEVQPAPDAKAAPDVKAAPEGKGEAAPPPAKRANPVPITGKGDPRAPGYIVLFENNVDAKAEVARLEKLYGFVHKYVYDMPTFKGFAAVMTDAVIEKMRWETSVHSIEHDGTVSVSGGGAGIQ